MNSMNLTINNTAICASADEAQALRLALTHYLKKLVSGPKMPRKPVVQRPLLAANLKWDSTLADVRSTNQPGIFAIKVGQYVGEISRAELLRLWKSLESDRSQAEGDNMSLVDTDFMDSLFETMKDSQ
jgi:hypothetical protein